MGYANSHFFCASAAALIALGINMEPAKAIGGCGTDVVAHAPGFIPNCSSGDPPGIHRFHERYCARKTEVSADGEAFCPPSNQWISKAEAYANAGYNLGSAHSEAVHRFQRSHELRSHENAQAITHAPPIHPRTPLEPSPAPQPLPAKTETIVVVRPPPIRPEPITPPPLTPVGAESLPPGMPEGMLALNRRIGELTVQLGELAKILAEQQTIKEATPFRPELDQTIDVIKKRIEELRKELEAKDGIFSNYLTSVRPNDRNLYLTARKASEVYPRVPYYIAGTPEVGEFWVEPGVDDTGKQMFTLKFVDPSLSIEKVRSQIELSVAEVEDMQKGLLRVREWSNTAHDDKIRKSFEKRVTCFPEVDCPPDGETLDGRSSTELRFVIYEDGSTAGRIQHNKGRYVEGYNFSIESGLLLQAYLTHVITEASLDFRQGTYNKDELNKLFK